MRWWWRLWFFGAALGAAVLWFSVPERVAWLRASLPGVLRSLHWG